MFGVTGIQSGFLTRSGELLECCSTDMRGCEERILESGGTLPLIEELGTKDLLVKEIAENVWVALIPSDRDRICVIGPAAFSNNETAWNEIPQIEFYRYTKMILMFYETISGREMSADEFLGKFFSDEARKLEWQNNTLKSVLHAQESKKPHHNLEREKRLLSAIIQGKAEEFLRIFDEPMEGHYGVLAKNKIRSNRNLGITMITLFSRAAVDGGISLERALLLSDAFINQLEMLDKWEDIYSYCRERGAHFAELVAGRRYQKQEQSHLLADQCEKLILTKIHERISVKELARELSVNADYLSRLFHESVGVTIGEYIQREKVVLARNMLVYSRYSIENIAAYLGFSSQSHFGRIFKRHTGMTPGQYRKQHSASGFNFAGNESGMGDNESV